MEFSTLTQKVTSLQLTADSKLHLDNVLSEVQLKLNQKEVEVVTLKDKLLYVENASKATADCLHKRDLTIVELEEGCRILESTVSDLKHNKEHEAAAKKELLTERDGLQMSCEEGLRALRAAELTHTALITEHQDIVEQLRQTQLELAAKSDENASLLAAVGSMRDSLSACEESRNELSQQKGELQSEVADLSVQADVVAHVERKAAVLSEKVVSLQCQCDKYCAAADQMDKARTEATARISLLETAVATIPALENHIASLSCMETEKRLVEEKMEEVIERNHVCAFLLSCVSCAVLIAPVSGFRGRHF